MLNDQSELEPQTANRQPSHLGKVVRYPACRFLGPGWMLLKILAETDSVAHFGLNELLGCILAFFSSSRTRPIS